MQELKK
jgi:hypothetical protein